MEHATLAELLSTPASNPPLPDDETVASEIAAAVEVFHRQGADVRPRDASGLPGCLLLPEPGRPAVVLPDIHGRIDLLQAALLRSYPEIGIAEPLGSALASGMAHLVCVGDYVHGERRVYSRWVEAHREYATGFRVHRQMDREMAENLTVLRIVAALKRAWPRSVWLLKGNHENIANESREGNWAFSKFVEEGEMVARWMERFRPRSLSAVHAFEKALGLMVVIEPRTIVSHAEPARLYRRGEVVEGCRDTDVVEGLTWTPNDGALPDAVAGALAHYLPDTLPQERTYIGGHRPVEGRYALRAGGRYVQIHNPDVLQVAVVATDRPFDAARDVIVL